MQRSSKIVILIAALLVCWSCTGPQGPPGPAGEPGPAGTSGYTVITAESETDSTSTKQVRAHCPEGAVATGAGWSVLDPTGAILEGRSTYFQAAHDGSHWLVNAQNKSTFSPTWKLRVRVICIGMPSTEMPSTKDAAAGSAKSGPASRG